MAAFKSLSSSVIKGHAAEVEELTRKAVDETGADSRAPDAASARDQAFDLIWYNLILMLEMIIRDCNLEYISQKLLTEIKFCQL